MKQISLVITNFCMKMNLFTPRKEKSKDFEPSAPPAYSDF